MIAAKTIMNSYVYGTFDIKMKIKREELSMSEAADCSRGRGERAVYHNHTGSESSIANNTL